MTIKQYFSVYIDILMLLIGLYMLLIQGKNLVQINHLEKEGQFSKVIGVIYIILGIVGIFILVTR